MRLRDGLIPTRTSGRNQHIGMQETKRHKKRPPCRCYSLRCSTLDPCCKALNVPKSIPGVETFFRLPYHHQSVRNSQAQSLARPIAPCPSAHRRNTLQTARSRKDGGLHAIDRRPPLQQRGSFVMLVPGPQTHRSQPDRSDEAKHQKNQNLSLCQ